MDKDLIKSPRLFVDLSLNVGEEVTLGADHTHYLKNVLRRQVQDHVRLFNGKDGEFAGQIMVLSKKAAEIKLVSQIKPQPEKESGATLYFAPIKKARMDILIEKAVELGVQKLCPVITARTENRKPNIERIRKQIIEASEQCERLSIPVVADPMQLHELPEDQEIFWAIERTDVLALRNIEALTKSPYFLIGPEGGFDEQEIAHLNKLSNIKPISLGPNILRAETAAIVCLTYALIGANE